MMTRLTGLFRSDTVHPVLHSDSAGRFDSAQAVAIGGPDQLAAMEPAFLHSLDVQFNVQSLVGRLCPVMLEDQSVALFALAEHVGSDQADELLRRVTEQGYRLASPTRYVLTAPLLLAIGRGQFVSSENSSATAVHHSRTALIDAFHDLVQWGVRHGASDLHINLCHGHAASEIRYTVAGRYVAPELFRGMPASMLHDMLSVAWMDVRGGNGAVFDPLAEQQGSLVRTVDGKQVILRWASLAADHGPSVCLRLLTREPMMSLPGLDALGYLPDQIQQINRALVSEGGAIIFAGTVGSGKSTTLASLVSGLPQHRKVITVEDPVEYVIPQAIQNTIARPLDTEAYDNYAAKLRALKRSAMSDVLLGEIRDKETGLAFMDLVGSGVNLYSTVHAASAALIPERLASDFIGVSRHFLSTPGMLKLLVCQALLPVLCAHCALPAEDMGQLQATESWRPNTDRQRWLAGIETLYGRSTQGLKIRNPRGCPACRRPQLPQLDGYVGRTVAAEILEPALRTGYLEAVQQSRLQAWITRDLPDSGVAIDSGDHKKTAMDSAMIKAFDGLIDPRDIESRFHAFETLLLKRGSPVGAWPPAARLKVIS